MNTGAGDTNFKGLVQTSYKTNKPTTTNITNGEEKSQTSVATIYYLRCPVFNRVLSSARNKKM